MNAPPRRRWFQLYLSTVIALTLVASLLLGQNLSMSASSESMQHYLEPRPKNYQGLWNVYSVRSLVEENYGWPYTYRTINRYPEHELDMPESETKLNKVNLLIDVAVGVFILIAFACLVEVVSRLWKAKSKVLRDK